jgi:hypothetical protein
MRIPVVLVCLCAVLCGCVTMRYPSAYKVEGREFREFKELDDERALKLVALIYNVKADTWEDGVARSIALEEYQDLLAKRNSAYVKNSGIFDIQYEKVKLSSLKSEDLIRLYDCLYPKANVYRLDSAPELSETQNAQRIVYLTAGGLIVKEMKKRDITEKAMLIAGQVLSTALMVALSLL